MKQFLAELSEGAEEQALQLTLAGACLAYLL